MLGYIAVTLLSLPWAEQVALAKADFAAYGPAARYLDFSAYGPELEADSQLSWKFWQPHTDRSTSLSHKLDRLHKTDLYRIDIEAIGWGKAGWVAALKGYPYATYPHDGDLLIVRADWLLAYGADASRKTVLGVENEVYFGLLFSGKPPKNKAEWLAGFGIVEKLNNREKFQVVPKSGPGAKGGGRRLIAFHRQELRWWETFDSARPSGKNDPALGFGQFGFDAGEQILELPKVLSDASYEDARVQAYFLTDKKQNKVTVATNDVVEDNRHFAGQFSIRVPGTCINCHEGGLLGSNSNLFVEYLRKPGQPQILVKDPKAAAIFDAQYLGRFGKEIRRSNEDFALFALDYLNAEPKAAVKNWRACVEWYDQDLDLAQAAREIHVDPETLRLAIAYWSSVYGPAPQFIDTAGLTEPEGAVPRVAWEEVSYAQCLEAVKLWRSK